MSFGWGGFVCYSLHPPQSACVLTWRTTWAQEVRKYHFLRNTGAALKCFTGKLNLVDRGRFICSTSVNGSGSKLLTPCEPIAVLSAVMGSSWKWSFVQALQDAFCTWKGVTDPMVVWKIMTMDTHQLMAAPFQSFGALHSLQCQKTLGRHIILMVVYKLFPCYSIKLSV